ncbi:MAG: MFS transporter [Gammaproteobacteria bacterium]|nr:MAG: MFS transporter [Gammaproteobacteria bacterium]
MHGSARPGGNGNDAYPPPRRGWYVVAILTAAYMVSFLDRQIMALLVQPIRADLDLSDTQISLLLGLAFALFYTVLGIPIGRLADRGSRRRIIAIGITIWCLMTAACGLARNFWQLFLARVGVGVGEATLHPCALSLISDYFPRESRGRAISVYNMGVSLGAGVAMILGSLVIGLVNELPPLELPVLGLLKPWQLVFVIVGLPGLLIALLMTTVQEPARHGRIRVRDASGRETEELSLWQAAVYLARRWRVYLTHMLGMSVVTIIGYALFFWLPTMFVRSWQWSIPQIGLVYGSVNLVCGPLGVLLAGWLADRGYRRGGKDSLIRTCLWFMLLFVPPAAIAPLMPSGELAILWMIPSAIGGAGATATGAAALMMYTPNQLRAQVTALYYFVINVLGLTLGPTLVALVTDYGFADEAALRYSLSLVCTGAGLFAIGFLLANLRHYRAAVLAMERTERA